MVLYTIFLFIDDALMRPCVDYRVYKICSFLFFDLNYLKFLDFINIRMIALNLLNFRLRAVKIPKYK